MSVRPTAHPYSSLRHPRLVDDGSSRALRFAFKRLADRARGAKITISTPSRKHPLGVVEWSTSQPRTRAWARSPRNATWRPRFSLIAHAYCPKRHVRAEGRRQTRAKADPQAMVKECRPMVRRRSSCRKMRTRSPRPVRPLRRFRPGAPAGREPAFCPTMRRQNLARDAALKL
jgi:hypothetical protein